MVGSALLLGCTTSRSLPPGAPNDGIGTGVPPVSTQSSQATQAAKNVPITPTSDGTTPQPSAPTAAPAQVFSAGAIRFGVVQANVSAAVAPTVTAFILPATPNSQPISETTPTLSPMTSTIVALGGYEHLNPDLPTYQQARIMVMAMANYQPDNVPVVTPTTGLPFFDALRLLVVSKENEAVFSGGGIRQIAQGQSPAIALRNTVTNTLSAKIQQLDFSNGRGVRFIQGFVVNQQPITLENLYYVYHGLTQDQTYYVAVVIPLAGQADQERLSQAVALPEPQSGGGYANYFEQVAGQLEQNNNDQLAARLAEYDAMVKSIAVIPAS